jgi:hypothetical protein
MAELRSLILVLGDQLDLAAAMFDGSDPVLDADWMAVAADESTQVGSNKPPMVRCPSSSRPVARLLQTCSQPLYCTRIDAEGNPVGLAASLKADVDVDVAHLRPSRRVMTAPGAWRVPRTIKAVAEGSGIALDDSDVDLFEACGAAGPAAGSPRAAFQPGHTPSTEPRLGAEPPGDRGLTALDAASGAGRDVGRVQPSCLGELPARPFAGRHRGDRRFPGRLSPGMALKRSALRFGVSSAAARLSRPRFGGRPAGRPRGACRVTEPVPRAALAGRARRAT